MDPFSRRIIETIRRIPPGRVTTYGIIAAAAGNHRGARQVARLLYSSSAKQEMPWHRVVNGRQEISPRASMSHLQQRQLLENEGIVFNHRGKIDFDRFLWLP
jgi:methylated-DNA-protein-cysteine methyltransferase-like protein